MVYYSYTVSQSNSCNVVDFFLPGGSILQQQTGQSGHQTRRAVALQRAQSVATSGTAPASATTPTQQVQKVTLQRAVSVDGGEVRTLVEGQMPKGASLVQTPSGKTVNTLLLFVQYR